MAQSICSFFGHLKGTGESQKQLARLEILCSFRIWAQKFCFCFGSRVMRESLKALKNSLGQKKFRIFSLLGSKTKSWNFDWYISLYSKIYPTKRTIWLSFCLPIKRPKFSFFYQPRFWKIDFFYGSAFYVLRKYL